MNKNRWLLHVGAGSMSVPALMAAKDFGLKTLCTDADSNSPGVKIADRFLPLSIYDTASHLTALEVLFESKDTNYPHPKDIVGVITTGTDAAVTCYACAQALRLSGLDVKIAEVVQNKFLMRRALSASQANHHQPRWAPVSLEYKGNLKNFIQDHMQTWGTNVVLKPIGQRASKGISIITDTKEIPSAIEKASQFNVNCLLEERLIGQEYSIEGIFDDGNVIFWNAVERIFDYSKGVALELGHVSPATDPDGCTVMDLFEFWKVIAKELNVTWGPFKIDTLVQDGKPYVLECASRISGGWDSGLTIYLSTGRSSIHSLIALATGMDYSKYTKTDDKTQFSACSAIFPQPGVVRSISKNLTYRNQELMEVSPLKYTRDGMHVRLACFVGDTIKDPQHCADRAGFVIVSDSSRDAVWERASFASMALSEDIITGEIN